jgi:hypothetical protein
MPEMDGFETATLIRQRPRTRNVPIIFVTADTDELHAARGYSLGAVDYLFSPFLPDILRTKVKVFVELARMHTQAQRHAEERVAMAAEQSARAAAEAANARLEVLAKPRACSPAPSTAPRSLAICCAACSPLWPISPASYRPMPSDCPPPRATGSASSPTRSSVRWSPRSARTASCSPRRCA